MWAIVVVPFTSSKVPYVNAVLIFYLAIFKSFVAVIRFDYSSFLSPIGEGDILACTVVYKPTEQQTSWLL